MSIIYDKCVDLQNELYRFILKLDDTSFYFYYSTKTKTNTYITLKDLLKSREDKESIEKSWRWYKDIVFRDYV